MASPFDPRKLLKQISNPLLQEFFRRRNELLEVPWDSLTEHRVDPILSAWQKLPASSQRQVLAVMLDVSFLSDHRGVEVLASEIRDDCFDVPEEFSSQRSKASAAMWTYLHSRRAFERASAFARADALSTGRSWRRCGGLPARELTPSAEICDALARELTSFYGPTQMRGNRCKVYPYVREEDDVYFFAYLDDFEEAHLIFEGDLDQPTIRRSRDAFQNVFVYSPRRGTLELFAPGGKQVHAPLQAAFARAVLGVEFTAAGPPRPSYRLDHLLKAGFPLRTDPRDGIIDARMTRVRIAQPGVVGSVEVEADPGADRNDIYAKLNSSIRSEAFDHRARALQATFVLQFAPWGRGGPARLTINVSVPSSCDLRHKPEPYLSAGMRFLQLSGVIE